MAMDFQQHVFDLCAAALLGGMLFFAAVVAPQVFRTLAAEDAGRFLRALFPRYYLYVAVTAAVAAAAAIPAHPATALALGAVALSTLAVRQLLVPRLNRWRDAELGGDPAAGRAFARGHRVSVLINVAQLVTVVAVLVGNG